MILQRIFTTYTFRFMVSYVMVLGLAVFVLLASVYALYSYEQFSRVQDSIAHELDQLEHHYRSGGEADVRAYIEAGKSRLALNRFFYILVDAQGHKLAGDLDAWPESREFGRGWLSYEREILAGGETEQREFMARSRTLADGSRVLVARHYSDLISNAKLMLRMLARGMLITILLGIIGGAWTSLTMLREVEAINRAVRTIMEGDLSERIPITGRGGDMEVLVLNFNSLLDRIQALMNGVRQVSDNIAHDLRTPLTRLRNHLSGLEQHCPPASRGEVQAMLAEADGLLATFNGLLRIAQVESGHRRAGFARVDLRAILLDVIEFYEPLAQDKGQLLETAIGDTASVTGDRDLLFQGIANVLDNAIKYTPEHGHLSVSLSRQGSHAVVVIADDGPGIPEDKRPKVFERFYRIEASRGQQPGNGLGLSLVAAVMKLHEGRIELADNQPGLRVSLFFPA